MRAKFVNEYIASQNHRVTVLTGNYPGARQTKVNGVTYIRAGLRKNYVLSRLSFSFLALFIALRFRCDCIINDCSVFAPCFVNGVTKKPCITILHHSIRAHAVSLHGVWGVIPSFIEKIFLITSKYMITPSKQLKEAVISKYPLNKVADIPNGISAKYLGLNPKEGDYILFLGRLDVYMKGVDILLDAFGRVKHEDLTLVIAGGGKEGDREEIQSLIRRYGLGTKVTLTGRVSERKKWSYCANACFSFSPRGLRDGELRQLRPMPAEKRWLVPRLMG